MDFTIEFDYVPDGALVAFRVGNETYQAIFNGKTKDFLGYTKIINSSATDIKEKIEFEDAAKTKPKCLTDNVTKTLQADSRVLVGKVANCEIHLYQVNFSEVKSKERINDANYKGSGATTGVTLSYNFEGQTPIAVSDPTACMNKYAQEFYEGHKNAPEGYKEILLRIANLLNSVEGDALFSDYEKYCNKVGSRRYYGNPDLWTPADYEVFEKALQSYGDKKDVLEAIILSTTNRDKLTDLAWLLVDKYSSSISRNVRLYILKMLADGPMFGNPLFGKGQEYIALKIIESIQNAEEGRAIVDALKSAGTLNDLYNHIDDELGGNNFTRFIVTLSHWSLLDQKPPTIKGDNIYYWDDSFINRTDINYKLSFNDEGNINIKVYNTELQYNGYGYSIIKVLDTEKSQYNVHPFDWVPVRYKNKTDYLPILGNEFGNITFVPAIYLMALHTKHLTAVTKAGINTAINVGSIFLGAGAFTSAYKIVRIVGAIDAIATTADIGVTWLENDIKQLHGGDEFLNAWATFNVAVGVASFGVEKISEAGIQNLDDFTSFINRWDNLKTSNRSNPEELVNAFDSHEELIKTEEIVEQVASNTGTPLSEMFEPGLINNFDDIKDVGIDNWKKFETAISNKIMDDNPNSRVGAQISLDVYYLDAQGIERKVRIVADNLIEVDASSRTFKIVDAKTSKIQDLTALDDLTSTCTKNQKVAYPLIDAIGTSENKITKVVVKGKQPRNFGMENLINEEINLESSVGFFVNENITDFTKFVYRSRKVN